MQLLIFGTGKYYQKYKNFLVGHEIVGFLDNDLFQQGTLLDGVRIFSPQKGIQLHYDYIFIFAAHTKPIISQLLQMGIARERIREAVDFSLLNPISTSPCVYSGSSISEHRLKKRALLISHELSYTGAPLALASLGNVLHSKGYHVFFASPTDNRQFRQWLLQKGMSVVIDDVLSYCRLQDLPWAENFDFIGINTVCLYHLLLGWKGSGSIFWWIHEVREAYETSNVEKLASFYNNLRGIFPYAVSSRAKQYFTEQCPDISVNELLYGLEDEAMPHEEESSDIVFAVIGTIAYRKGTDLFLKVVRELLDRGHINVHFWVIGKFEETAFGKEHYKYSQSMPQVEFLGELPHKSLMELFTKITAVLVPSRDETMSIAANEAMMHGIGCIVSEDTGVAPYVQKGHAGIVCPTEDTNRWVSAIEWVIENPNQWREYGTNGRIVYEQYFSMRIFEKNVDTMLHEISNGFESCL